MKQTILITLTLLLSVYSKAQTKTVKTITKNKMTVSWYYQNEKIFFKMNAPTDGWVTIGFNTASGTKGAYLLMGNIIQGQSSVVEYYTVSQGNYKSIRSLGETPQVKDIKGNENSKGTTLTFSLPINSTGKFQKELSERSPYTLILAYSQQDDFQHHSIMRTSVNINL